MRPPEACATRRAFLYLGGVTALAQDTTFRTTVPLVVVPVTVMDAKGKLIDGLESQHFLLLDNGQPCRFDTEEAIPPIALIVAVQTGGESAAALTKIRRIGSMIEPLLTGRRGLAAVVSYGEQVRVVQRFTSSPDLLKKAVAGIRSEGASWRLLDTVTEAIRLFDRAPSSHRRVLLMIGERRDLGSESSLDQTLTAAQRQNIAVYALTYSPFLSKFAVKQHEVAPAHGMNLLTLFTHLGQQAKANAMEVFTNSTGGRYLSFLKQDALERAVAAIGEELHGQYLLSFSPTGEATDRYHALTVRVNSRPDAVVRARPGYWL